MTTVVDIQLSPDQKKALDAILSFWQKHKKVLTLGGYAGTGKTTIVAEAVRLLRKMKGSSLTDATIAYCCYTGKAADVLRRKLTDAGVLKPSDYCGTIHKLIYTPEFDEEGNLIGWRRNHELDADIIIVDEASMVNKDIWDDLREYGIPILAVGDHGQLPPVKGKFNLMDDPQIRLEKIHRQAEDNPIIKLSLMARTSGYIPFGSYGKYVHKIADWNILSRIEDPADVMVLCGWNRFRTSTNQKIRYLLNIINTEPVAGDRVICLRNNSSAGIFNGMVGTLKDIEEDTDDYYWATIDMDGGGAYEGRISRRQFNRPETLIKDYAGSRGDPIAFFDYGYCQTVWKAQGSEHNRVVFFEQRHRGMDDDTWRKFLYTAVTRSCERLIVVGE